MKKSKFRIVAWIVIGIIWIFNIKIGYNIIHTNAYTNGYINGYNECAKNVLHILDSLKTTQEPTLESAEPIIQSVKEKTPGSYEFISRQGNLYSRLINNLPNSTGIILLKKEGTQCLQ